MVSANKLITGLKALRELGPQALALYGLYRFGLSSGHYRRVTSAQVDLPQDTCPPCAGWQYFPILTGMPGGSGLERAAGEICQGKFRPFQGEPQPLIFPTFELRRHWTEWEKRPEIAPGGDIKFIWEPARFDWAVILAAAYTAARNEDYAKVFWERTEEFLSANPPYQGPQWMSGQEVGLRLIALVYAWAALAGSPHTTPQRTAALCTAVAAHARRILPTLVYARSQRNNHLLSEAAGLYTAGLFLSQHPAAPRWRAAGWRWFNHGLATQIAADGTYMQHSTNYHRLMLTLALWMDTLQFQPGGKPLPETNRLKLAQAAQWLADRLDVTTGSVPNQGANDGACILPESGAPFNDFRPVVTAALQRWPVPAPAAAFRQQLVLQPAGIVPGLRCTLRAARFTGRPSHADQLHVDIWWRRLYIARDAGTYRYNANAPWDNALAGTAVHNTVVVDGKDQMTRAGRFLWLDWAQAEPLETPASRPGEAASVTARHAGYRRAGIIHQRSLAVEPDGKLVVEDLLLPASMHLEDQPHTARLHWLFPDWPWAISQEETGAEFSLQSPHGWIRIQIEGTGKLTVVRAGQVLTGSETASPILGWYSPTYGVKEPALAVTAERGGGLPIQFRTRFEFPY